ncbi:uncharacterized protein MONOS_5842 [Monocercomonoides exilis]|uniref:uncharacterized protein n=1 Tax=Monocercomonoides exilis TaxID=2049356 RepID=UPI003559B4B5|nr:hypothetical protein MONOS_5842 [Monocercomonoides exilis]|eukprot:MONOS_5842.1-p1 / transcript=MONOS_5842.1 / gene=MONOS_5842 / organism=Monocercomonoides_exilis_PA203 / gene_product=unspecified product / transcript_product=unspecified product / location=Mono_scaffold00175:78979-80670(+) / protein_length=457 / sequence_SO=supercontig / SO=protein_coding / is_pseudo=false
MAKQKGKSVDRLSPEYNVALQIEAWKKAVTLQFDEELKQQQTIILTKYMKMWAPEKKTKEEELNRLTSEVDAKIELTSKNQLALDVLQKKEQELIHLTEKEKAAGVLESQAKLRDLQIKQEEKRAQIERKKNPIQQDIERIHRKITEQEQYLKYFESNRESYLSAQKANFVAETQQREKLLQSALDARNKAEEQLKLILSSIDKEKEAHQKRLQQELEAEELRLKRIRESIEKASGSQLSQHSSSSQSSPQILRPETPLSPPTIPGSPDDRGSRSSLQAKLRHDHVTSENETQTSFYRFPSSDNSQPSLSRHSSRSSLHSLHPPSNSATPTPTPSSIKQSQQSSIPPDHQQSAQSHTSLNNPTPAAFNSPSSLPPLVFPDGYAPFISLIGRRIARPQVIPQEADLKEERARVSREIEVLMGTGAYSREDTLIKELMIRRDYYDALLNERPSASDEL